MWIACYGQVAIVATLANSLTAQPVPNFTGLPRTMSAAAYVPDGQGFYLFGGLEFDSTVSVGHYRAGDDLWQFSRQDNTWRQISAQARPAARSGHSLSFDEDSGKLLLLGGVGNRCLDTLWTFGPKSQDWVPAPTSGMGTLGGALIDDQKGTLWSVFGRCGSLFKDIFSKQNDNGAEWVFLQGGADQPVKREGHVAAIDSRRERLLIYGGVPPAGSPSDRPTIEVWAYSPADSHWEKLSHAGTGIRQERSWGAGAYSPASDALIVFGGIQTGTLNPEWYSKYGETFDDLAVFDLQSRLWTTVPVTKEVGPRAHAASSYCPCTGTLLIAGGVDTSAPISVTRPPIARIDEIQIEKHGTLRLVGNGAGQRTVVGFLDVPDATGELEDLRLVNCVSGQTTLELKDVQRLGNGRYRLKFAPGSVEPLLTQPAMRIMGRIHGDPLGFIATVESGASSHARDYYTSRTAVATVSIAGSTFKVESRPGNRIRVEWFDVRGRLLSQQSYEPNVMQIGEPRLATGVYFARVSAGGKPIVRRVYLKGSSQ